MDSRKKLLIFALLFSISIANFSRNSQLTQIRTVDFIAIFAMGALAALLIREILVVLKNK